MEFDKKKLIAMVEKKLQDLLDSEELVDHEAMSVVKGKPMPEDGKGLMDLLKMFGGGKAEIEIEQEESDEMPMDDMEEDESGVSAKNKKMIMMALSKK